MNADEEKTLKRFMQGLYFLGMRWLTMDGDGTIVARVDEPEEDFYGWAFGGHMYYKNNGVHIEITDSNLDFMEDLFLKLMVEYIEQPDTEDEHACLEIMPWLDKKGIAIPEVAG